MNKPKHHLRLNICATRAPYREGRKPTAVKVYTVNQESKYLLIQGVPAVGASQQLVKLFEVQGDIDDHKILDDYPSEQFTEVHLIKFKRTVSARFAKKRLDDWNFYGGVLHVCYAPEYETIQETREKIEERRRIIEKKTQQYKIDGTYDLNTRFSSSNLSIKQDRMQISDNRLTTSLSLAAKKDDKVKVTGDNARHEQSHKIPAVSASEVSHSHVEQPAYIHNMGHEFHSSARQFIQPAGIIPYGHMQGHSFNQNLESFRDGHCLDGRNLKRIHSDGNELNTNQLPSCDNNLKQDTTLHNDQLFLPPPPKQSRMTTNRNANSTNNGFAKVPTANATFPPNFDARLEHQSDFISSDAQAVNIGKSNGDIKTKQENMLEKFEDKVLVIKEYSEKKMSVSKFIPRQTLVKKEPISTEGPRKELNTINDELNKALRKNAFTLGEIKGPTDSRPDKGDNPLPQEISIAKTVQQIRKKLTQNVSSMTVHLGDSKQTVHLVDSSSTWY